MFGRAPFAEIPFATGGRSLYSNGTEALVPADSDSAVVSFVAAVAETSTPVVAQTVTAVFAPARAETLVATDAETVTAAFSPARAETLVPLDAQTVIAIFVPSVAETLVATDTQSGPVTGNRSAAETAVPLDTPDAQRLAIAAVAETNIPPYEQQLAFSTLVGAQAESIVAADTSTVRTDFVASTLEALNPVAAQTVLQTFNAAVADYVFILDTVSALRLLFGAAAELLVATDHSSAETRNVVASTAEAVQPLDATFARTTFSAIIAELATAIDAQDAAQLSKLLARLSLSDSAMYGALLSVVSKGAAVNESSKTNATLGISP